MMRRILVDRARTKGMGKGGGGALHVNLEDVPELALGSRSREIVAVDEALDALAQSTRGRDALQTTAEAAAYI
jgi:hypothetical protein